MNRKGSAILIVLLVMAAVLIVAGIWYWQANRASAPEIPISGTTSSSTSSMVSGGWKTYTNSAYGFSFRYPDTLYINSDSGTSSVIFSQNATSALAAEYDLAVSMDTNPKGLSMQQYFSNDINDNGANFYKQATLSTNTIDSLPATIFSGSVIYGMTTPEVIVVPYQGGFLEIINNNLDTNTFNSILKTFVL